MRQTSLGPKSTAVIGLQANKGGQIFLWLQQTFMGRKIAGRPNYMSIIVELGLSCSNISNMKDHVWSEVNTEKRVEIDVQWSIFDILQGVWKSGQALSWVLDISSQLKSKVRWKCCSNLLRSDIQTLSRSWFPLFRLDELLMSLRFFFSDRDWVILVITINSPGKRLDG